MGKDLPRPPARHLLPVEFRDAGQVDLHDDARDRQERRRAWCKLGMISATGFLAIFGCLRLSWDGRRKTVRFPDEPSSRSGLCLIHSVSTIVRRAA